VKEAIDSILQKLTTTKHHCPKCDVASQWQSDEVMKDGFVACHNCGFTFPVKNAIKWNWKSP